MPPVESIGIHATSLTRRTSYSWGTCQLSLISLAKNIQRCQHDPALREDGSYKQFEETVQWGECGQNTSQIGYRVKRLPGGMCRLSSAWVSDRDVPLPEIQFFLMQHCASSADQSKSRTDDCNAVASTTELQQYMMYMQCKTSVSTRSC